MRTKFTDIEVNKMRIWLGNGEFDIDCMMRLGILTEQKLIEICETLVDSPWYKEKQ